MKQFDFDLFYLKSSVEEGNFVTSKLSGQVAK